MIHLLPESKVEFVRMKYPEKSTFLIDVVKNMTFHQSGILRAKAKLNEINHEMIIRSFDSLIGNEIIRLCDALHAGKKLTLELLGELNIKGDELPEEDLLEEV